jgi:hypothetical protein
MYIHALSLDWINIIGALQDTNASHVGLIAHPLSLKFPLVKILYSTPSAQTLSISDAPVGDGSRT